MNYSLLFLLAFSFFTVYFIGSVYATPPCTRLPSYVYEFSKYYENVQIRNDTCIPGFTFTSPRSYSKFNVPYKIDGNTIPYSENITDFDLKLREAITRIENCTGFEKYVELRDLNEEPISPDAFTYDTNNPGECTNLKQSIDYLETLKIVNDFLTNHKGDYNYCRWDGSESFGNINTDWAAYVDCDGKTEYLMLSLDENKSVKEAFFANSASEVYRQIYPQDVKIRERNPAWERMNLIGTLFWIIVIPLTLLPIIFLIRRIVKNYKSKITTN